MSKGFAGGKGYGTRCPAGYCGSKGFRSSQGFGAGEAEEGLVYLPLRKTLDILSGGPEVFYKEGDATYSRPGVTTYIENGALKEAAANVPVFEGGMFRCFGPVTNRENNSVEIFNGSPTRATLEKGSFNPAFGRNEAVMTATGNQPYFNTGNQSGIFEVGKDYCVSVHFRRGTISTAGILLHPDSFSQGFVRVFYRWSDGSLIPDTGAIPGRYGFEKIDDDNIRLWISATCDSVGDRTPYVWPKSTPPDGISPGETLYAQNIQVEEGVRPSPFIPTSGSSVTCPKSDCQFPTPAALSGDSWEWSRIVKKQQEASDRYIMSCGNVSLYVNDTNVTFAIGTDMVTVNGLLPDNVETEITIQKTPTQITLNGTSIPLTQIPAPGPTVQIGADVNQLNQLNGYIKEVRISE